MKSDAERRSYNFEIRAEKREEGGNIITGRPIVYNQRTDIGPFDEVIAEGALAGTDLTDVRFLVNHDTSMIPLARSRRNNGNSTMKLTPDAMGLNIDYIELDVENNVTSRALYSAVERGDITGMSFMFWVDADEWMDLESDHPTRIIKSISSVVEISACTFPAYDATEIYARSKEALENAQSVLERARQLFVEPVDTRLELLKEKTKLFGRRAHD